MGARFVISLPYIVIYHLYHLYMHFVLIVLYCTLVYVCLIGYTVSILYLFISFSFFCVLQLLFSSSAIYSALPYISAAHLWIP